MSKRQRSVRCNVGNVRYFAKPTGKQCQTIQTKELLSPQTISVKDLAEKLVHGYNTRATACAGNSDQSFISAETVFLDFDNGQKKNGRFIPSKNPVSPSEVRQRLEDLGIPICFQYATWNAAACGVEKFRTVLILDEPITSGETFRNCVLFLLNQFSKDQVDRSCYNPSRIFFGSDVGECIFFEEAEASTKKLIELAETKNAKPKAKIRHSRIPKKSEKDCADSRIIEAIRTQNAAYLKRRLGMKRRVFDNNRELFDAIYRIPLDEFLGVEVGKAFRCVIPDHEDRNPSASVYVSRGGTWRYKCHADCCENGTNLNIKQLIEIIGGFESEFLAMQFICTIFNFSVKKTKWSEEQLANIDSILQCICSQEEDGFSAICPTAEKVSRNAISVFMQMLVIAKGTIYPTKTASGNIIFYASVRKLAIATEKRSLGRVQNYLKELVYLRMIELLPDSEVPKEMLQKAKARSEDGKNHTQFYQVPSWVFARMRMIEDQGQKWKANKYTVKGISYEMFARNEPEEAERLYPQIAKVRRKDGTLTSRRPSKAAEQMHDELSKVILTQIEQSGFTTKKNVISVMKNKQISEKQLARSLTEICNIYQLEQIRSNAEIKRKYGISSKGYPVIIVPEDR